VRKSDGSATSRLASYVCCAPQASAEGCFAALGLMPVGYFRAAAGGKGLGWGCASFFRDRAFGARCCGSERREKSGHRLVSYLTFAFASLSRCQLPSLAHRVCRVLREGAARCGISVTATSAAAGPWVRRCGEARQRAAPEAAEGGRGPPAEGGGVSASVPRAGCARTAWARSKRRGRAGPGGARSASAAAAKLREGNRGWRQGPGWKRVSGG